MKLALAASTLCLFCSPAIQASIIDIVSPEDFLTFSLLTGFDSLAAGTYAGPLVVDGVTITSSSGSISIARDQPRTTGAALQGFPHEGFGAYVDILFPAPVSGFFIDSERGSAYVFYFVAHRPEPFPLSGSSVDWALCGTCGWGSSHYSWEPPLVNIIGLRLLWATRTAQRETALIDDIHIGVPRPQRTPAGIPEPGTWALMAASLIALALWRRRAAVSRDNNVVPGRHTAC